MPSSAAPSTRAASRCGSSAATPCTAPVSCPGRAAPALRTPRAPRAGHGVLAAGRPWAATRCVHVGPAPTEPAASADACRPAKTPTHPPTPALAKGYHPMGPNRRSYQTPASGSGSYTLCGRPNVPGSTHDPNSPTMDNWQSDNAMDFCAPTGTKVRLCCRCSPVPARPWPVWRRRCAAGPEEAMHAGDAAWRSRRSRRSRTGGGGGQRACWPCRCREQAHRS